jgi:KDO2-lipid IV(A) lauroyltransferase
MTSLPPPIRWLYGNSAQRAIASRYWIKDPFTGLIETAIYHALLTLPIDMVSGFGGAISLFTRRWYRESEQRAREAWARLRPAEAVRPSVDAAMTRLWSCVSRTMTEFAVLNRLWSSHRIAIVGAGHLELARRRNQPIIVAGLHLGNWEVIGFALKALGEKGAAIYLPPENRFEHRIAHQVRGGKGFDLIAPGPHSGRAALTALQRKNRLLLLFIDEICDDRVNAPFFGRQPLIGGNIAYAVRLAALTGAVIVPAYCARLDGRARFQVNFMPPMELARSQNRNEDMRANVIRLNEIIEPVVLNHLDQWYFVLDFEFDDPKRSAHPDLNGAKP